jgi:hypothetical protein
LFGDFLSAILTADYEIRPDDSTRKMRETIRRSFKSYGIVPSSPTTRPEPGIWKAEKDAMGGPTLTYKRSHFESMQRDTEEVFYFIWENRKLLELAEGAFTRVESVRPCIRVGDDGFLLRETVASYIQVLELKPNLTTTASNTGSVYQSGSWEAGSHLR